MSDAEKYGQYRWGVLRTDATEIEYVWADACRVTDGGALILESADKENPSRMHVRYAYSPAQWSEAFAASVIDGSAIAVD